MCSTAWRTCSVDAKERLRRYLEQRRELGESELVLDGLAVDEVLSLIGAKSVASPRAAGGVPSAGASPRPRAPQRSDREVDASAPHGEAPPWPDAGPGMDVAHTAPSAPATPPPTPEVRFDRGASTDWREALRNAGAARPGEPGATAPRVSAPIPSAASSAAAPVAGDLDRLQGRPTADVAPAEATPRDLPAWLVALELPAGIDAARLTVPDAARDIASLPTLEELARHVSGCRRCALHATAKHPVPGEGNVSAELLCVGETPGVGEDESGRPFVGEAGELFTKILGAIQLSREDVFLCNVLKHRPPGNRDPLPEEVAACQPYLVRQIELVRPRVILALGRVAAQTLLQTSTGIGALRGRVHRIHGIPLIVTYHPAALLRNEAWKRPTWEDVKLARRILDASRAAHADQPGS